MWHKNVRHKNFLSGKSVIWLKKKCFTKQEKGKKQQQNVTTFFCCEHANKHAKLVDVTFQEGKRKKVRMMNDCETGTSAGTLPKPHMIQMILLEREAWWLLSDNVNVRERLEVLSHLIQNLSDGDLKKYSQLCRNGSQRKSLANRLPRPAFSCSLPVTDRKRHSGASLSTEHSLPIVEELIGSPSSVVSDVAAARPDENRETLPHIT